uniref:Nuclear shuttle protein n=1 Tax=East African cassava mosaic Kenya virus TaxID=393599 RepID=I6LZE8_9GEMI|nr:nuclear shuttle protein [East African cassava mosaic Kenya virus]
MYSVYRRGYKTPYRSPYGARVTPYVYRKTSVKQTSKSRVPRKLAYEAPKSLYTRRSLEDIHNGASLKLPQQGDYTSYVTLPCRGIDGNGGRSVDHIKLLSLRVSGTVNVSQGGGDENMGERTTMRGIFFMVCLVDKKPFVPEGVSILPTFNELFGEYESVYGMPRLEGNVRHRYRVIGTSKLFLTTDGNPIQKPFNLPRKLNGGKYPIWSSFKDGENKSTGGNYKNINKNAILVGYVGVSLCRTTCDVYSQFVLNYVG